MKIKTCKIGPMPKDMFDPMPTVSVVYEDESEETLFSFYPDELSFTEAEFIGKTRDEAMKLRHDKDVRYIQS